MEGHTNKGWKITKPNSKPCEVDQFRAGNRIGYLKDKTHRKKICSQCESHLLATFRYVGNQEPEELVKWGKNGRTFTNKSKMWHTN